MKPIKYRCSVNPWVRDPKFPLSLPSLSSFRIFSSEPTFSTFVLLSYISFGISAESGLSLVVNLSFPRSRSRFTSPGSRSRFTRSRSRFPSIHFFIQTEPRIPFAIFCRTTQPSHPILFNNPTSCTCTISSHLFKVFLLTSSLERKLLIVKERAKV